MEINDCVMCANLGPRSHDRELTQKKIKKCHFRFISSPVTQKPLGVHN